MKIAVNIQPMLHLAKSGIGYYEQEILKNLLEIDDTDSFFLQYFSPRKKRGNVSASFSNEKASDDACHWFSATLYQLIWTVLPVPYKMFFSSDPDVSVFFNYYLPPGVKGKKMLVVYDTVIKDHPETMSFKTKTMLQLTLARSVRRADKIITISEFSKRQIMKHYNVPADDIVIIPCAADADKFRPVSADKRGEVLSRLNDAYGIKEDYFLYLGTLEPRKNISRLIEAYAEAQCGRQNFPQLVIAGGKGWQFEEIFRRAGECGVSDKIVFTGYIKDEDVAPLMGCARAFCFPSLYEGFGMPPLEAMSCGVPVIVSNTSSLPEVTGSCGISVDPLNVSEISSALVKFTDDEFRAEQSRMSLEQSKAFSWKKSAGSLLEIIREIGR